MSFNNTETVVPPLNPLNATAVSSVASIKLTTVQVVHPGSFGGHVEQIGLGSVDLAVTGAPVGGVPLTVATLST